MAKNTSRRQFLRLAAASSVATGIAPTILTSKTYALARATQATPIAANDKIRLATIGFGGMGHGNTSTALRVDGVEFVAAADCYDGRLKHAKELYGKSLFTTRDYREILAREDIDAVIIATPDHWHAQITIEALNAGKAVYCEKPMVQKVEEGAGILKAEKESGNLLIVGSQRVSSLIYEKARDLYKSGAIGELNMVEAVLNRNSALGAWQYTIPPDASPKTCDWDTFLGNAPQRPFDATRFFRWRNYQDYGTGIPGDLFVHLFSGIHLVLDSNGPERVMSTGGIRYWKDGRDVPDIMLGLYDYPETDTHPAFNMSLQVNFADGGGGGTQFRFIGNEGVITINSNNATLTKLAPRSEPGYSTHTFDEAIKKQSIELYRERYPQPDRPALRAFNEEVYTAPRGYDDRYDHFNNFFTALRTDGTVIEDGAYGLRAAAPALLTNVSYETRQIVSWDPEAMKIKKSM